MSGLIRPGLPPLIDAVIGKPRSGFPDQSGYLSPILWASHIEDKRIPSHPYIVTRKPLAG
jgi:hypothetical protein